MNKMSKKELQKGFLKLTKKALVSYLITSTAIVGSGLIYLFNPWTTRTTEAAWFNDNWGYRQIVATTNNTTVQSNYVIQLSIDTATLITAGKMQSNCADLRVTDVNSIPLPYFIVGNSCNSATTSVFVKATTVPAGTGSMYIYYGNPTATSQSSYSLVGSDPTGVNTGTGADGAVTVSANKVIDTANMISGRSCADGGDGVNYSVTASVAAAASSITLSSTPSSGCLTAGDEVLIINLQGTSGDNSNVGKYETARITAISTATLSLDRSLTNAYDGTTQKIMVQRVPNYTTVTVNGSTTLSTTAFNGTKAGVMMFRATGTVTATGTISANASGFQAGAHNGFCNASNGNGYGVGGISTTGYGGQASGYCSSSGLPGGGGGGYGTAGTAGTAGSGGSVGSAGATYGTASLSTLYFGGGGGDGINWNGSSNGTQGGGIVFINAGTVTVTGAITATGGSGADGGGTSHSGRGGGAGGSVKLYGSTVTLGSSLVTAAGGSGGGVAGSNSNGGAGGSGRIAIGYSSTSGSSSPSADTSVVPVAGSPATEEKAPAPVAYWKFDDGTGTNAQDVTTNNADGTLAGTTVPTWQMEDQCISGKCLYFDGSTSKVTVAATVTAVKSVSMWVKPNTLTSTLIDLDGGTHKITVNSSGVITATGFTSPTSYVNGIASASLVVNTWNYVTVTTGTSFNTSSSLTMATDGTTLLKGFIDEVKLYNKALSQAEINANYNSRSNPEGAAGVLGISQGNNPGALNNGLVGYWKMDEASGNRSDSSGNANTLTDNATVTTNPGKFGNAGQFTRANLEYLSITDNTSLSMGDIDMTLSGWVYFDTKTANRAIVFKGESGAVEYGIYTEGNAGVEYIRFVVSQNGTNNQAVDSATISTGTWYFVVATHDSVNNQISIQLNNGTPVTASWSNGIYDGTSAFKLGLTHSGEYMDGRIDDFRVYKRLLSLAERTQLYNFAPGPLTYYNFDENTGTSVYDKSGNALTGTWSGSSSHWKPGKYGSAGNLVGANTDFVDITSATGTSFDLGSTKDYTLEAWVKTTDTNARIISKSNVNNEFGFKLGIDSSGFPNIIQSSTTSSVTTGTTAVNDNKWHYIVGIRKNSGTTQEIYIDGVLNISETVTAKDISGSVGFAIGKEAATSSLFFDGLVDDVKIYNYARTADQIVSDMNAGHPSVGSPVGSALAHWKFDEGALNTCSGGSNDACNSGNQGSTLDGAFNGDATYTQAGKFGKALSLDGTGDYVSISDHASLDFGTGDFAISAWIYGDDWNAGSEHKTIFCKQDPEVSGEWCLQVLDDSGSVGNLLNFRSGASNIANSTTQLSNSTWYHVSVVRSGTTVQLYINGLPNGSAGSSSASLTNAVALNIGRRNAGYTAYFDGLIDEAKIYNYALTEQQVKLDMNRGSAQVLGAISDNSSYQKQAANQEYCIPGDSTSCAAPVGRWDFSENTGSTANDTSGNGNTGTITGATFKPGKIGPSLNFNGTSDYVDTSNNPFSNAQVASGALSAWVKTSTTPGSTKVIADDEGYTNIQINSSGKALGCSDGNCTFATSTTTISDGRWHFITVTWSGTSYTKIYIDGVLEATATPASAPNPDGQTRPFTIGQHSAHDSSYFTGQIDQVRIFNYARSAAQVAWDYNKGAPVAHWRMDECQGSVVNDASGMTNNGTITVGASGTYTSVGTCPTSSASSMWYNGATGKFNSSLAFDGTDDYISITDTANLRFDASTSDFSIFAWVKRTTTGTEYILSKEDADNDGYRLMFTSSNTVQCSEDATDVTSTLTITDTNWHHVGCTIDRDGNGQVYIDGKPDGSTTSMGTDAMATTSSIVIGARSYTITSYLNGQIDDVKVYNYPLTATQVKQLYNENFSVRYGPTSGTP